MQHGACALTADFSNKNLPTKFLYDWQQHAEKRIRQLQPWLYILTAYFVLAPQKISQSANFMYIRNVNGSIFRRL